MEKETNAFSKLYQHPGNFAKVPNVPKKHNKTKNKETNNGGFIPKHGGYRNLITYQKSENVYDGTIYFTNRFFRKHDRTTDRWCRQQGQANKTLLKQAWHQLPQKKQK